MSHRYLVWIALLLFVSCAGGGSSEPAISVPVPSPVELDAQPSESAVGSFSFRNSGSSSLAYSTGTIASWLAITSGGSGNLAPGATATVHLEAACPENPDSFSTVVEIFLNGAGTASRTVSVMLECADIPLDFTRINWRTVAPSPLGRAEAQGAAVDGKLYVFGGYTAWTPDPLTTTRRADVYDPRTNSWSELTDLPEPLTHGGTAVDGRDIYIAGGYVNPDNEEEVPATTKVWKYTIDTDGYTEMPPLPEARGAGALVLLGRNLHFFGGNDAEHEDRGEHWMLSLEDGSEWTPAAPLPNPRNHLGFAALGGRIYAIGGQHGHQAGAVVQRSVHAYDPEIDSWTQLADLPLPLSHIAAATLVLNERILVLGGEIALNDYVDSVLMYDPLADSWTSLTPLPQAINSGVAGIVGGRLYFTTGGAFSTMTYRGVPAE